MRYRDGAPKDVLPGGRALARELFSTDWFSRLNVATLFSCISLVIIVVSASFESAQARDCPPQLGIDTDCGVYIEIADSGSTLRYTGQRPYDDDDDTLVGVINNSKQPIFAITLRSDKPIFDFEEDGICGVSITIDPLGQPFEGKPSDCPFGPTKYEGPGTSFSDIAPDHKSGTVRFNPPLAPHGGKTFFALEANLTAQPISCADVINSTMAPMITNINGQPTAIEATFKPKSNLSRSVAAGYCGFRDFNWIQTVTHQDDPSPRSARNLNGLFDSHVSGLVRLNSCRTNPPNSSGYNDPPNGGGFEYGNPDYSYPFYYDYNNGGDNPADARVNKRLSAHQPDNFTLTFFDRPGNECLPGGGGGPKCSPDSTCTQPANTKLGWGAYKTRLAGVIVNADGSLTAVDTNIGFDWHSTYNANTTGGIGGVTNNLNLLTSATGSTLGTGGVTITAVHNVTNYHYNDIVVTAVNDAPVPIADGPPVVTVSTSRSQLWPPRPWLVPVTISGTITDLDESKVNPSTVTYVVQDEYELVQPKGPVTLGANGQYSFTVELQPTRKNDDKDGRLYTIWVSAADTAGNLGSSSATMIVPHDKKHHRDHDRDHDDKDDDRD